MLVRKFEDEAEKFLIDYSVGVRRVCMIDESGNDGKNRFRAFDQLRKEGIKRIKGLVAEFGLEIKT